VNWKLPVLKELIHSIRESKNKFSKIKLFTIQHMFEDTEEWLHNLNELGIDVDVIIGWTAFTSIIYFLFSWLILVNFFESILRSHSISILLSTLVIPAFFLFPIASGYCFLSGKGDRKTVLYTFKKVLYAILANIGLTVVIKVIELSFGLNAT